MAEYKSTLRDRIAWRIMTFTLKRIATPWYRNMISGAILLGLQTAAGEGRDG